MNERRRTLTYVEACFAAAVISAAAGAGIGRGAAIHRAEHRASKRAAQVADKVTREEIARAPQPAFKILPGSRLFEFVWRLEDLYAALESNDVERRPGREHEGKRTLSWTPADQQEPAPPLAWIEHASDQSFENPAVYRVDSSRPFALRRIFVGDNYWRIAGDDSTGDSQNENQSDNQNNNQNNKQWSKPSRFVARGRFLDEQPSLTATAKAIAFPDGPKARLKIQLGGSPAIRSWLIEAAADRDFPPETAKLFWSHDPLTEAYAEAAPILWLRARGVSAKRELTAWSAPVRVRVAGAPRPGGALRGPASETEPTDDDDEGIPRSEVPLDIVLGPERDAEGHPIGAPLCRPPGTKEKLGLRIAAGVGMAYVRIQEGLSDVSATYGDMRGPTYDASVALQVTDRWAAEAGYSKTPFELANPAGNSTLKAEWDTLSLEFAQRTGIVSNWLDRCANSACGANSFELLYGLQLHRTPLALNKNSDNSAIVRDVQLLNASLGARYRRYLNPWTRATMVLRGQKTIQATSPNSGSTFGANSSTMFDGSIGADKRVADQLWLGLRWRGQYQGFDYTYGDADVYAAGNHTALFSTVEFRLSLEY